MQFWLRFKHNGYLINKTHGLYNISDNSPFVFNLFCCACLFLVAFWLSACLSLSVAVSLCLCVSLSVSREDAVRPRFSASSEVCAALLLSLALCLRLPSTTGLTDRARKSVHYGRAGRQKTRMLYQDVLVYMFNIFRFRTFDTSRRFWEFLSET